MDQEDELGVFEEEREAREKADALVEIREKERIEQIKAALSSRTTRLYIWTLLESARIFQPLIVVEDSEDFSAFNMSFQEGRRNFGLQLWKDVQDAGMLETMMSEAASLGGNDGDGSG